MKILTLTTLGAALLLSSAGAFASHPNKGFERTSQHAPRTDRVVIHYHSAPPLANYHFRNHEWTPKHSYRHLQRDRWLASKARPRHAYPHNHWRNNWHNNRHNKQHDDRYNHRHSDRRYDQRYEQPLKLQSKNVRQQWKRSADPRLQVSSDRAHGQRRTPHQQH